MAADIARKQVTPQPRPAAMERVIGEMASSSSDERAAHLPEHYVFESVRDHFMLRLAIKSEFYAHVRRIYKLR